MVFAAVVDRQTERERQRERDENALDSPIHQNHQIDSHTRRYEVLKVNRKKDK